jgi:hypothetical protein
MNPLYLYKDDLLRVIESYSLNMHNVHMAPSSVFFFQSANDGCRRLRTNGDYLTSLRRQLLASLHGQVTVVGPDESPNSITPPN